MAFVDVVRRVFRKKYLKIRSGITLNSLMTAESSVITETDSSVDRVRNSVANTETTKVGHLYRQFTKKKRTKKSKLLDATSSSSLCSADPLPETTRPLEPPDIARPPEPSEIASPPEPPEIASPPETAGPPETASPSETLCSTSSRSLHPALEVSVVHAPLWLVADHFASEHIAHEHVSVTAVPDHADPVLDDVPPPPLAATSPEPATSADGPSVARTVHVSRQKPLTIQQLVDELIGPYYYNYSETRAVLIRQAKQLLANVYQADIVHFHKCFCLPASEILKRVVNTFRKNQMKELCEAHKRKNILISYLWTKQLKLLKIIRFEHHRS